MEPIQLISFALILLGVYLVGREMGRRAAQRDILRSLNSMFMAFHAEQIQHAPDCPVHEPQPGDLRRRMLSEAVDKVRRGTPLIMTPHYGSLVTEILVDRDVPHVVSFQDARMLIAPANGRPALENWADAERYPHAATEARIYRPGHADGEPWVSTRTYDPFEHPAGPLFDETDPVSATVRRTRENDERVYGGGE